MRLPRSLIIMGVRYRVEYTRGMVEVDVDKRNALWGQVDFHTRTIRVFRGTAERERSPEDQLQTLMHEIVHAILQGNHMLQGAIRKGMEEPFVDNIATILADTLTRNRLVRLEE